MTGAQIIIPRIRRTLPCPSHTPRIPRTRNAHSTTNRDVGIGRRTADTRARRKGRRVGRAGGAGGGVAKAVGPNRAELAGGGHALDKVGARAAADWCSSGETATVGADSAGGGTG